MTPRTETRELTEHERLSLVKDKSQAIGDFVEWLAEKGIHLARYHAHSEGCYPDDVDSEEWPTCGTSENKLTVDSTPITKLLAEHFDIDLDKLETEKRQMLADIRKGHAAKQIDRELGL
jgi:hypothetical protein